MATRKPKAQPVHVLDMYQVRTAIDLLKTWDEHRRRYDLYRDMAKSKSGQDMVRFVDQESHREILDVPAAQLAQTAKDKMVMVNAELVQLCGIRVEHK